MATNKSNYLFAGLIIGALTALCGFGFYYTASANPSSFLPASSTASATSSVVYMTPGAATTTIYHDAYTNGQPRATDSAVLLTQMTASSTSATLGIKVEYAAETPGVNCTTDPTACDWYEDNLLASQNSTSSPVKSIQIANSYSWTAAATTRTNKAIEVSTPTRYTRTIYSLSGANAAIWGQIVPKRQSI